MNGRAALSLLCLAPPGVFTAAPVALGAVGSYPTISTLPVPRGVSPFRPSAVYFLLHFPSAPLPVRVPCFHKADCPTVSGLSSTGNSRPCCDRPGDGRRIKPLKPTPAQPKVKPHGRFPTCELRTSPQQAHLEATAQKPPRNAELKSNNDSSPPATGKEWPYRQGFAPASLASVGNCEHQKLAPW